MAGERFTKKTSLAMATGAQGKARFSICYISRILKHFERSIRVSFPDKNHRARVTVNPFTMRIRHERIGKEGKVQVKKLHAVF
jgi:hypothetical protein